MTDGEGASRMILTSWFYIGFCFISSRLRMRAGYIFLDSSRPQTVEETALAPLVRENVPISGKK